MEAWQAALRKQFGLEQKFKLENVGGHAVFSDFQVTNPQSKQTYRVAISWSGPWRQFLLVSGATRIAELRDQDHRRRRLEQTFPEGIRSARFDKLLRVPLCGYQREGAMFAARAGRCRLPVVMGLPGSRWFVVTSGLARASSDFPFPARKSSTAHEETSRLCCRDIENDLKPGESHSSVPATS